jgi:hypothetical protein
MKPKYAPTLDEQARSGRYSPETRQYFAEYDHGREDGSGLGMAILLALYGTFMWWFGFAMRPVVTDLWQRAVS